MRTNLFPNPRNLPADSSQSWGQWTYTGTAPTIANYTGVWLSPVMSCVQVTWANPTAAGVTRAGQNVSGLTVGAQYAASVWVRVPSGAPAVYLDIYNLADSAASQTNDAWEQLSVVFTASATTHFVSIKNAAAVSTAGQVVYVSQPLVELGTTVGSYFDGGWASGFWNSNGSSTLASQVPQRINHCLNPSFEQGLTYCGGSFGSGGVGTTTIDSTNSYTGTQSAKMTYTTGNTSGSSYFDYYLSAQGCMPGVTYTFSAWVYPSVTMSIAALLEAYNVAGSDIKATYGPFITCPANTWTQLWATETAPAGALYMRPFILWSGATATGTTINFDAFMLEQTSQVLPYFDGTFPNCAVVGTGNVAAPGSTAYGCSMSQALPSANPNLPVLEVNAWPTRTVYGTAAPVPTNGTSANSTTPSTGALVLSDRVTEVQTQRGRQYELDTDQTGSLTLKLDNSDGAVNAMLNPYNNIQVSAVWQGVSYDLWTGYCSVVPTQNVNARNAWSALTGVDGLDVLANRSMRNAQQEAILASNPERFFPLDDAVGSQNASDLTQNSLPGSGQSAPLAHFVEGGEGGLGAGSMTSAFGSNSVAVNGGSAWTLGNIWVANGANPRATQLQVCGPLNSNGYQVDTTKPFAVEITAQVSPGTAGYVDYGHLFIFDDAKGSGAGLFNGHGGPYCEALIQPSGSGLSTTGTVTVWMNSSYVKSQTLTAAQVASGVHVVFSYDGAGHMTVIVNGVSTTATMASVDQANLGLAQWIGIGGGYGPGRVDSVVTMSATTVTLQNFAIYASQLGVPGSSTWTDHYNAFLGYANETAQTRTARILGWAGMSPMMTWPDGADQAQLAAMQDPTNSSALSVIQGACQSVLSRFVINESGNPVYQDRYHGLLSMTPVATFGSNTAAGEIPYTEMPTVAADPQHIFNDVTITRDNGTTTRYADAESVAQFFQRVLQVSSSVVSDYNASMLGPYLTGRYAEPIQRVSTLSFDLAANPSITATMLGLHVGDFVVLNHRTAAGTLSLEMQVDQLNHDITSDGWKVSVQLSPLYRYWIMAANRSTVNTAIAAGATSVIVNPMLDAAYNPAEAGIAYGSQVTLSPGTANAETMTVASVTSSSPGNPGYSTATVTFTAATKHAHAAGDVFCDALPSGYTDPSTWDAYSLIDSTTIPQW